MTQIIPWLDEPDDLEPVDLEEEAQKTLTRLRGDPAGERLAEMLPDLLLIGVACVGDLFALMRRYRRLSREMQRRQYAREDARRAAARAEDSAALTGPPEETGA
jgi:hypothetical protein